MNWSSPKTDLEMNFLNLENRSFDYITFSEGIMLPSKSENLSCCSTKLIHVCKKLPLALSCRKSKYSE